MAGPCRNYRDAVDMPLQHPLGLNVLGIRILVRCSDNYGVTALSGNCSYSMSTIGKEGIVEIWNDESTRAVRQNHLFPRPAGPGSPDGRRARDRTGTGSARRAAPGR